MLKCKVCIQNQSLKSPGEERVGRVRLASSAGALALALARRPRRRFDPHKLPERESRGPSPLANPEIVTECAKRTLKRQALHLKTSRHSLVHRRGLPANEPIHTLPHLFKTSAPLSASRCYATRITSSERRPCAVTMARTPRRYASNHRHRAATRAQPGAGAERAWSS